MFTQNPFTVLNNTSNSSLHVVIIDLEVDNIDEQLDVFKLEELARAAVVEANYKHFIESQKARDAPRMKMGLQIWPWRSSLMSRETVLSIFPWEERTQTDLS